MNSIRQNLSYALAAIVAVCTANVAFAAVEITLHDRVVPHASVVRLGDVADVKADDRQVARQLASLPLMPAPARGTERFLRTREIQDMLAAQGVDAGDLRFAGHDQVLIDSSNGSESAIGNVKQISDTSKPTNRHAAILAGNGSDSPVKAGPLDEARAKELHDQLTRLIGDYVNAKTGKAGPWQVDCDVENRQLAQLCTAKSQPVCAGGSEPWTGRQRFLVSFSSAEGPVQLPILANVTPPPIPAVFAVRPIARGDVIRAADLELRTIDTKPGGNRGVFDSIEKLIGMEARQSMQTGDVVMTDDVQAPILVKRGEMVTVTSQGNGIRVRTSAKALRDGSQGDLIQLESVGTKEKFDARVVGTRETEVFTVSTSQPITPARVATNRRTKSL